MSKNKDMEAYLKKQREKKKTISIKKNRKEKVKTRESLPPKRK